MGRIMPTMNCAPGFQCPCPNGSTLTNVSLGPNGCQYTCFGNFNEASTETYSCVEDHPLPPPPGLTPPTTVDPGSTVPPTPLAPFPPPSGTPPPATTAGTEALGVLLLAAGGVLAYAAVRRRRVATMGG